LIKEGAQRKLSLAEERWLVKDSVQRKLSSAGEHPLVEIIFSRGTMANGKTVAMGSSSTKEHEQ